MRIGHLTTVDSSLRFLLFPQLRAIVEAGDEAVAISAPGPWVPDLEAVGIRHVPLVSSTRGMDPFADIRACSELVRILRRERLDVLHTHNPKPGLYGRVAARLTGVPIVVNTNHGLYATDDDPLPKRLVVYGLEAIASRFSDAELVQSEEDLELLNRWRLVPRGRAIHLGNGIDLTVFDPGRFAAEDRRQARAALSIADDEIVVGSVGRLVAEKGFPELFEAGRRLGPAFTVVVIGPDDPHKPDALDPAVLAGASREGVQLLGWRDDIDALYPAMDIFALPSHREGFPRAAMEAAAMGLPIVTTDVRGCRQVVEDGVNGLLVPVRNPVALTDALRRLGDDRTLRREMGEAGRRRAIEHFDERTVVRTVMDTYRDLAEQKNLASSGS